MTEPGERAASASPRVHLRRGWIASVALLFIAGCDGSLGGPRDGGPTVGLDARADEDAAPPDASFPDAGPRDAALPDASAYDAGALDAGAADAGGPCPDDMVAFGGFCMDRFEAPNVAGAPPLAMQNALDGEAWCATHEKRLCSEAEWVRACEGPLGHTYPYRDGETYVSGLCNDDETWISPSWATLGSWPSDAAMAEAARLYQGEASGSNVECVSSEGVYDLTGNVAEWVRRSFDHTNNYDHVMKGCYWSGCFGGTPPNCGFTNPAHPSGFRSYEAGFRCCLDLP